MFKMVFALSLMALIVRPGICQDVNFNKSRYSSLKQPREEAVDFSVTDTKLLIRGKKVRSIDIEIPYTAIDSISYELAARHRVAEGAAVMAVSLGVGAVLMATKTKSHWLAIEYQQDSDKETTVLRLDKSEYKAVLAAVETKTGKPVVMLDAKTSPLSPAAGSKDMDEIVAFSSDKVLAALPAAMGNVGCKVTASAPGQMECKRTRGASERAGGGGEKVTATVEAQGEQTRVRIWTGKGFVGRVGKKNWSTPVYQELMKKLQTPAA